jgi:hypothetical protein
MLNNIVSIQFIYNILNHLYRNFKDIGSFLDFFNNFIVLNNYKVNFIIKKYKIKL